MIRFFLLSLLYVAVANANEVKLDVANYINKELPKFVTQEAKIVDGYTSATENYVDDQTSIAILKKLVPTCKKMMSILEEKVVMKTLKVSDIHELYIESMHNQCSAIDLILLAFETDNEALIQNVNDRLALARKKQRQWLFQINALKKEFGY